MDPLTQGVVGAVAAVAVARADEARIAALAGTVSGLLADADVLIRSSEDPLLFLDYHRHFTHSLTFIPIGAAVAWAVLRLLLHRFRPALSPGRLYLFCLLGYATHGLLDACTSYGTRLLWPFSDLRVAWNVVSVIDPLFTLPLLALLVTATVRRSRRWVWAAAGLGLLYLGMGTIQRERAEGLLHRVAAAGDHVIARGTARPSFGNLILWRGVYATPDGRLHTMALRPGLLGLSRASAVASAPRFETARDLTGLDPARRQARDIDRFDHFSDGWLVRLDPAAVGVVGPVLVGDFRYAAVPDQIRPLWGIRIDPQRPDEHVEYLTLRDFDRRDQERFVCMLGGGCLTPIRAPIQAPIRR